MKSPKLTLISLPDKLGICHLAKHSPIPSWADKADGFCSVTRTEDELSVVCPQDQIPAGIVAEKEWRIFKVKGPLGFSLTGIVDSLATPLAKAKITIFYISTYQTDYLMVEEKSLAKTIKILGKICKIEKK